VIKPGINYDNQSDRMWVGQRGAASSAVDEADNTLLLNKSASNSSSIAPRNGVAMDTMYVSILC